MFIELIKLQYPNNIKHLSNVYGEHFIRMDDCVFKFGQMKIDKVNNVIHFKNVEINGRLANLINLSEQSIEDLHIKLIEYILENPEFYSK